MQAPVDNFQIHIKEKPAYYFLSSLVVNRPHPRFFQFLQFCSSEVQYIAILIWMRIKISGKENELNPASKFIHDLCKTVSFGHFLDDLKPRSYFLEFSLIVLWIYMGLFFILISYLVLNAVKRQQISLSVQKNLTYIFQLHFGIIFWMANTILIAPLLPQETEGYLFSLTDGHSQTLYFIQIVFTFLNYGFGFLTVLFCFDPFNPNSLFSVHSSIFQLSNFIFKAVIAPLAALSDPFHDHMKTIFAILALLICSGRLIYLFKFFPFFDLKAMKLALISTTLAFWISLLNIFSFLSLTEDCLIWLILLLFPIIMKLGFINFQRLIHYYMAADPIHITTQQELLKKVFAYNILEEKVKISLNENTKVNPCEIYFMKDLWLHSKVCQDTTCFCSFFLNTKSKKAEVNLNTTRASLADYFKRSTVSLLADGISRMRHNGELKIELASILSRDQTQRKSAAFTYLFSISENHSKFLLRVKKHILVKRILSDDSVSSEKNINSEYLNIRKFINYQRETANFLSQIMSATTQYLSFWEYYKGENLKIWEIIRKSAQIEKLADYIDKLWEYNVIKYEPFYHAVKDHYRIYLSLVRNAPFTSMEAIKKFKWKKKVSFDATSAVITENDLASSGVMTFFVSMTKGRIGKLIFASENTQAIIGHKSEDLVGRNINCLMPAAYAEMHDQVLLEHLERSKSFQNKDYYHADGYMKNETGFILPCSNYIAIFPYIQKELVYIGIVKIINSNFDYIVVDRTGHVDAFTEQVGKCLNLTLEKKRHITEVCPDFDIGKINGTVTLTYIRQTSSSKRLKYNTNVIKRIMAGQPLYILELQTYLETKIKSESRFSKRNQSKNSRSSTRGSILDIPAETALNEEIRTSNRTLISKDKPEKEAGSPLKISFRHILVDNASDMNEDDVKNQNKLLPYSDQLVQTKSQSLKEIKNSIDSKWTKGKPKEMISITSAKSIEKVARIESEGSSIASVATNVNNKLEKAIYSLPKDKMLGFLQILTLISTAICIILLILSYIDTKEKLGFIDENISVITSSNLRLFQITELNRRARLISLYTSGLIEDKRYLMFGTPSIIPLAPLYLHIAQEALNSYNLLVRAALEKIDTDLQKQLYSDLIPVIDPTSQKVLQYANIFDAVSTLVIKAKQLSKGNPYQPGNVDLAFILNNTLNEQLIVSERVPGVVLDDNKFKLRSITNLIVYFTIISCLLVGSLLVLFSYHQFKSIQSRDKFIEIFLRLDDTEINQALSQVRTFKNCILKTSGSSQEAQLEKFLGHQLSKHLEQDSVKKPRSRVKKADMKGINLGNFRVQAMAWVLALLLLGPFIYMNVMTNTKKTIIEEKSNILVKVNTYLYDLNLASTAIYEYIQYNKTTKVRTQKIAEELEATFQRLSGSHGVFIDLLQDQNINELLGNNNLDLILSGNLCSALNVSQVMCGITKGALDKGIFGLNNYIELALRRIKDMFDASDRSFKSAKSCLSFGNLIDIELIYTIMQMPAYQKLGSILKSYTNLHIRQIKELIKGIIIAAVIIYLIPVPVSSYCLWKLAREEKMVWKKVIRKIPFNISISNKALKGYLARESDHFLDSV